MRRLRAWISRLVGMVPNSRRERELADEIASHLQLHIDDNIRAGMNPEEARRIAILKLGGIESTKQNYRERSSIPFFENLLQDFRYALRQLRKNPGFTCTAVLMLAGGMCACVAIFAFVDAALVKPLPYRNPSRLVGVFEYKAICERCNLSYLDYLDWKKLNTVFSSLAVYQHSGFSLSTPAGAQKATGARVSDGFFRTLGIIPFLGRDFYAGEDSVSQPATALLSYAAWQNRFGGKPDALGQTVMLSGVSTTIIGVLPADFHYAPAEPAEFWAALQPASACEQRRSCHNLYGVARLRDGVSVQKALAAMALIAKQLEKQYPGSNRDQGANVLPLSDVIVGNIRTLLLVLWSGAGLLLLIACVNIASLLLVRSEGRKREMAVRTALGASRARLIHQFVTEGLLLVAAGSAMGLMSARWAMQLLTRLIPKDMLAGMPYLLNLELNIRVLSFAEVIALLAALLFSITPILRLWSPETREGLAEGSRGSAGTSWRRLGSRLVVLELAIAMVLLVGAGLLGKSFYRLLHVELGFQPDHLATLQVGAPKSGYSTEQQIVALERRLLSLMESLPGIKSAAITTLLPVTYNGNTDWIRFAGKPYHGEHNEVNERDVSGGYLATLQAKLLRGRYFSDAEDESKPRVAIINQTLARQYFPGEDPIGRKFGDNDLSPGSLKEIVGIVDDVRESSLDSDTWPTVYYPFNQNTDTYFSLLVRTSQAAQGLLPTLAATIHNIDPGIVTAAPVTMTERINDAPSTYLHRSAAWLVGAFAAAALLLGVVGLYGVIAYSVSQRTREIGIRMALGAHRGSVYQLILKEAGWLTAAGVVAGLVCSLGAATLLRKLLFGTPAWDVPTLAGVAVVLAISALLASFVPARQAASVNPVEALRAE